jgi:predicted transcriptional regulator
MKDPNKSTALALKSSFLLALSERAKELSQEIESIAFAAEWVEDSREELADVLADEDSTEADKVAARVDLAKREARLADHRAKVDLLEARLSNFKDDASCLVTDNLSELTSL